MPENPVPGAKRKNNKASSRRLEAESCRSDELAKKRKHALKIVSDAISRGAQTYNADHVSLILEAYCTEFSLPVKHFDVLDREARLELALEVKAGPSVPTREEIEHASPHTAIQFGQTTPKSSRDGKTKSVHAAKALRLTEVENGPIEPVEPDSSVELLLHLPDNPRAKLVVGSRYKCSKSYISRTVATRYGLKDEEKIPGSIRLEWREGCSAKGGKKTKESRFWLIDDDKIEHDVALGKNCNEIEPPLEEEECSSSSEEDDDVEQFGVEQDNENDNGLNPPLSDSSPDLSENGSATPIVGASSGEGCNPLTNYTAPDVDGITAQDTELMGELIGAAALYIVKTGKRTHSNATVDASMPTFSRSKPALSPQKSPRISGGRESPSRPSEEGGVRSSRKSDTSRTDSLKDQTSSKFKARKK